MSKRLQDKVAIVTGGAGGVGEVTARVFVAEGARAVIIADIDDEKGHRVVESICPRRCSYFHCNITDEEQVKCMVEWTAATYGGLDVFFANAGINTNRYQSILHLDLQVFDRIMQVNARGTATCVKHAARKMVELGTRGAIVCTASISADRGSSGGVDYAMSKCAVVGLVRTSVAELGEHGIRINCVSPSAMPTALAGCKGLGSAEEIASIIGPLTSLKGVALSAEHVAETVAFLASEAAGFVTGHNLVVDGGIDVWLCTPLVRPEKCIKSP